MELKITYTQQSTHLKKSFTEKKKYNVSKTCQVYIGVTLFIETQKRK